ncbi:MAG: PRC-barrel domain-containing protein [Acidimicrobiales bacterium]
MTETTRFTIGADASCTDGICGEVSRVVVDPLARAVTHLVVEPKHRQGLARLVPLDLVGTEAGAIQIGCSLAEFDKLTAAEETHFLPEGNDYAGYGPGQVLYWPYYGLGMGGVGVGGMGGMGLGSDMGMGLGTEQAAQAFTHDAIPVGEVAVRRGEHVHATDGNIGKVQGLVIDAANHHVTHVLLQEGHLWGRKQVAIPIGAVDEVNGGIRLKITKQEVQALPPVDVNLLGQ